MMTQCVLKVKQGQFVTVRMSGEDEPKLYCVDRQPRQIPMQIYTRIEDDKIQMAFSFMYKNSSYSPMVEEKVLKLEEASCPNSGPLSNQYWFERIKDSGDKYYILQSVAQPGLYLSSCPACQGSQRIILELSEDDTRSVKVTDEQI